MQKLRKRDIPKSILAAFPGYRGRKFKAKVTTRVIIGDLHWSGGTRSQYVLVRLNDGLPASVPSGSSPWNSLCEGQVLDLPPGFVCVEHSVFCGKDAGLTIHVHPDNVAKLLPVR